MRESGFYVIKAKDWNDYEIAEFDSLYRGWYRAGDYCPWCEDDLEEIIEEKIIINELGKIVRE